MHPSLQHRRPGVSRPISLLPLTTALPISSFAGGCKSCGRGIQAAAASIPDNITLPALSPPRHPGTQAPLVARHRAGYSLTRTSSSSSKRRECKVKRVHPHPACLALPCLDSTPAAGCTLLARRRRQQQHKQQLIIAPAPRKRGALIAVLADGASVCSGSSGSPIPHFRTHPAGPDFQSETSSERKTTSPSSHRCTSTLTPPIASPPVSESTPRTPSIRIIRPRPRASNPRNTTPSTASVLHCLPAWTSEQADAVDWPASGSLFPYT